MKSHEAVRQQQISSLGMMRSKAAVFHREGNDMHYWFMEMEEKLDARCVAYHLSLPKECGVPGQ